MTIQINCQSRLLLLAYIILLKGIIITGCVSNNPNYLYQSATLNVASMDIAEPMHSAVSAKQPSGSSAAANSETPAISQYGPHPPRHVIVSQGPTDSKQLYAIVSWDRNDISVTGYEVFRDNVVIGTVLSQNEPWNDTSFKDRTAKPGIHRYTVRAISNGIKGRESAPYQIRIRSDADFGKVYNVDSYSGSTDSEKINKAIAAATSAGGGIIQLSPRIYKLSSLKGAPAIDITGNNIVIRGAGIDKTVLQPDYPGWEGTDECPGTKQIVRFKGTLAPLATRLASPIKPGDRKALVNSASGLKIGQVILFSQTHAESEPAEFFSQGLPFDPGTGQDDRYPYESNEIVDIKGTSVKFKYPFSYGFTESVPWRVYVSGMHNVIELLTIQGRSENEQTFYDALTLNGADNYAAEVKAQWTNRRMAGISGHNLRLVGFQGPFGGPKGMLRKICRYKVQVYKASNVLIVDATMGRNSDDHNMSLVTIQQTVRVIVRNSQFFKSRTYAVNEHGEGSRHLLVENNRFAIGDTGQYAILLGNDTWGFSGPIIIRNNVFENNQKDIQVGENSYEARILDNVSYGVKRQFIYGSGWAGPFTSEDLFGSMRMTIARNQILRGASGIYLGSNKGIYPFPGVRDILIFDNILQVSGDAITLNGNSNQTKRFQVFRNKGTMNYIKPTLVDGDYWSGNADGVIFGKAIQYPWSNENFAWEEFNRN
jgi:hypothetical protein